MISDAFMEGVARRLGPRFIVTSKHYPTHDASVFTAVRLHKNGRQVVCVGHLTAESYVSGRVNAKGVADGLRRPLKVWDSMPQWGLNRFRKRRAGRSLRGK